MSTKKKTTAPATRQAQAHKTAIRSINPTSGTVVFDTDAPTGSRGLVTINGRAHNGTVQNSQLWIHTGKPLGDQYTISEVSITAPATPAKPVAAKPVVAQPAAASPDPQPSTTRNDATGAD